MRNDLKVSFYLKKNEADSEGQAPVMGRIRVGKTEAPFSAKTKVPILLWDTPSGRALGKSRDFDKWLAAWRKSAGRELHAALTEVIGSPLYRKGLSRDPYKGATFTYDELGYPKQVSVGAIDGTVDYHYTSSGQKLQARYRWRPGLSLEPLENTTIDKTSIPYSTLRRDYVGNKIYENNVLKKILLPNGYIENNNYYFYLRDHLGSTAVTAKADGSVIQRLLYYPYGSVIEPESMGVDAQPYKFGGKEEEPMHGLGFLDYHARQLNMIGAPVFTSPDPHAENYYPWSPYAAMANNPIRITDPTGMDWVSRTVDEVDEYYYDRDVRSQDDITSKYGKDSGISYVASGTTVSLGNLDFQFWNDASEHNEYGVVSDANGNPLPDNSIIYGDNYTIFGTTDNSVNAETLHKNLFPSARTSYIGPNNPKDYNGNDSYQYLPRNLSEYPAYYHDKDYDKLGAKGALDAFTNIVTYQADRNLANRSLYYMLHNSSNIDRVRAGAVYLLFNQIANVKSPIYKARQSALKNIYPAMPYAPF
jgi:RHS repeat-associated protein